MAFRLGAVPYLNALPLIYHLEERPVLAPPGRLDRLLRTGEIEIATAPIVTLFENPSYTLIPGICIGSNGPVESVKLFFRSPETTLRNVGKIVLDPESRTSVILLKLLLKSRYRRDPGEIRFMTPLFAADRGGDEEEKREGRLLIGDKAMIKGTGSPAVDLGEEWTAWTGLPFVYAAWISRHRLAEDGIVNKLTEARDKGVRNIPRIIPAGSTIPFERAKRYLENLLFTLGPREAEGIELFRKLVAEADLMEQSPPDDAA